LNYSTWIYKCFALNYQFYSIGEAGKKHCIFNNIEGRSEKMHRLYYAVCICQNLFKNFTQQACFVNIKFLSVMQNMMEVRVQFHAPACILSQNEPSIFIAKEVGWALANANDIKLCEFINRHFYIRHSLTYKRNKL
jgi:hypothetical protein